MLLYERVYWFHLVFPCVQCSLSPPLNPFATVVEAVICRFLLPLCLASHISSAFRDRSLRRREEFWRYSVAATNTLEVAVGSLHICWPLARSTILENPSSRASVQGLPFPCSSSMTDPTFDSMYSRAQLSLAEPTELRCARTEPCSMTDAQNETLSCDSHSGQ